jgi:rod shape determining protein RodA
VIGVLLLVVVEVTGVIGKGAQRWLNLGFMRFQPSEIMKLGVPMLARGTCMIARCRPTGARW